MLLVLIVSVVENTHGLAYEIGSEFSEPLPLTERPAVFDCRVLTLDEAALAQTSSECLYQVPRIVR
jgi:hypothetical protein